MATITAQSSKDSDVPITPVGGYGYGAEIRKQFLLAKGWRNLNHGSFGVYPRTVRDTLRAYQDQNEVAPDRFIRYSYPPLLDISRAALADNLNVPTDEVVVIPNVTTGVNTVLRSLRFNEGDVIVYFDTVYSACEKSLVYMAETTPVTIEKVVYDYPISDEELLEKFKDVVRRNKGKVRLALFDTVVSLPGVRMPFERLTEICREEGILSLIDGAHGMGHIPLDLGTLKPDFFVSNVHKWLYVPRGCAVFHAPLRNQHLIRSSLPTSHGFEPLPKEDGSVIFNPLPPSGKARFIEMFQFVGTIDNANYLCIPAALKFRKEVCGGEQSIMEYSRKLAKVGGQRVAEILGTEVMDNEEGTLTNCAFANVRVPLDVGGPNGVRPEAIGDVTQFFSTSFVDDYDTFIAVVFYRGHFWARFSGQIYLDVKDFEWGAKVLLELCEKIKGRGEWVLGKPVRDVLVKARL